MTMTPLRQRESVSMTLRDPPRWESLPQFLQKISVSPEWSDSSLVGKENQRLSLAEGERNSGCLAGLCWKRVGTELSSRSDRHLCCRRRGEGGLNAARSVLEIEEPLFEAFNRIPEAQTGFFDPVACE